MKIESTFPHLVIRASAGTGKTYQLAVRFIGLLAAGARPNEILATTFTRKAAGEILDRVLYWLAQAVVDDGERAKLAQAIRNDKTSLSRDKCRELLIATCRQLHTLRVGTLDSYFLQVATSFGHELGLPPGWTICDEIVDAMLRDEAIELTLSHGRTADLLTLVHALTKGEASRSVARLMRDTISSLLELYRETAPEAWRKIQVCRGLNADELERLAGQIAAMEITDKRMAMARDEDLERCRRQAWEEFICKGLAGKVLCGECVYYKQPLPPELIAAYQRLLQHAESILVGQVARQTEATCQLLERFTQHYAALQLDERALRFSDITARLAAASAALAPQRMAFRLDGHIRHVLLDEFQDTSPAQWRVLRPLAQHVTSRPGGSFFCVGDAKQAIYGWRGGVAEIFDALDGELTGLSGTTLAESFRSSQPVIDAVNAVFRHVTSHPHLDKLAGPVQQWQGAFPEHKTARTELAGHVTLATAPEPSDGQEPLDAVFEHAAELVKQSIDSAPRASVGVLVRTNAAVARLIYRLRQLGIPASEEGGNPLIDSPAVELILSLLKIADHPGDRVARFHVARSPLTNQVAALASEPRAQGREFDHSDPAAAARVSQSLRRQLLDEGYGATVFAWAKLLAPHCDERDLSRLQQLVELAYDYQPTSTLRTDHFLRLVESQKIADPQWADVRVMTIHQAKGLQFDVVVLPELEARLVGQPDRVVTGRPSPTEPVNVVCRHVNEHVRQFFPPQLKKLFEEDLRLEVHESLCVLYVAMTRAVHALHMLIAPAKANEKSVPKTFAGLLRATLAPDQPAAAGQTLYEHGDRLWAQQFPASAGGALRVPSPSPNDAAPGRESVSLTNIVLAPSLNRRHRGLERTSPSSLEGGERVVAASVLKTRAAEGFNIGTLVHAWLERIEWLDAGLPTDEELCHVAERLRSEIGDVSRLLPKLITRFRQQLAAEPIARVLARRFYASPKNLGLPAREQKAWPAGGIELAVHREHPFAIRTGDKLLKGSIDRLVVIKSGGKPIAADVLDYKTDELPAGDQKALTKKVEFYSPQIEAYRAAVAKVLVLDPGRVTARLLFLAAGTVCRIGG